MTSLENEALKTLKRLDMGLSEICLSHKFENIDNKSEKDGLEDFFGDISMKINKLQLHKEHLNRLELCDILIAKKVCDELKGFCISNEIIAI